MCEAGGAARGGVRGGSNGPEGAGDPGPLRAGPAWEQGACAVGNYSLISRCLPVPYFTARADGILLLKHYEIQGPILAAISENSIFPEWQREAAAFAFGVTHGKGVEGSSQ